jgi:predicted GIY-YIG superfamily endonuclease
MNKFKFKLISLEDRGKWGVYGVFYKNSNKCLYIGATTDLLRRVRDHHKPSQPLQRKHRIDISKVEFRILENFKGTFKAASCIWDSKNDKYRRLKWDLEYKEYEWVRKFEHTHPLLNEKLISKIK